MNSFSFFLSGKLFICPLIINDSFAEQSNLGCRSVIFVTLNISFFTLYFIDYVTTIVLNFLPFPSSIQHYTLPAIPTLLFMSMGHVYKFFRYSISYTVLYTPWLFCNYLFVLLNPFLFFTHPPDSSHLDIIKMFYDFVSVLLVHLFCFLDSIVDRYVFIAILLFIFLIFLFLKTL